MNDMDPHNTNLNETSQTDDFEKLLAQALRPVEAPEDLQRFLMATIEAEQFGNTNKPRLGKVLAFPRPPRWLGAALAATVLLGVFGTVREHQLHQRQAMAEREFEAATQITDRALDHARQQMLKAGVPLD